VRGGTTEEEASGTGAEDPEETTRSPKACTAASGAEMFASSRGLGAGFEDEAPAGEQSSRSTCTASGGGERAWAGEFYAHED
jgi:hypothetical protein